MNSVEGAKLNSQTAEAKPEPTIPDFESKNLSKKVRSLMEILTYASFVPKINEIFSYCRASLPILLVHFKSKQY